MSKDTRGIIYWKRTDKPEIRGNGRPMSLFVANRNANAANREYPKIYHWVERVTLH